MDKSIVNNQVVLMRKFVKQAKTHIINKCAKNIKALQNKKGNDSQMLKYKRKVERLRKEIAILKNMKPDFVSKLALSKAKNWESVLKKKNISLEERCLSMLANYTAVKKEVDKFHFNQSHLISKIPSLILEWEEKSENSIDIAVKKQNKAGKISKNTEFRNASFPNNIKITKKVETRISDKPMLPHLSSKNCTKVESSEQSIKQQTLGPNTVKLNIQRKIKLKKFLNQSDNLIVKKEKSKKIPNGSSDKCLEQKSVNFQSPKITNNKDDECQIDNENDECQTDNKDDECQAYNEDDECQIDNENDEYQSDNESNECQTDDEDKDCQTDNESDGCQTDNKDDEYQTESTVNETTIFKKKKQILNDSKNKHVVIHAISDIKVQESDKNDHHSEIKTPTSPVDVSNIKTPESDTKSPLKDKHACKKLNLKTYLQPLKSASKNDVSVMNQSAIFSKLEAISRSDFKKSNSKNMNNKKTKTIAILDLNELHDLDEIPLEDSPNVEESTKQTITRMSDPFFLTGNDSENDKKDKEKNCAFERLFKARKSNFNKKISDSNFSGKEFTNMSSYRFKSDFNSNKEKNNGHFRKNGKHLNLNNKRKFKGKEAFSEKNQFGNKRNLRFEMKKPLNKNQNNFVPKNFHKDKEYINKEVEDKKPVHPSWAAKQKLKESLKIGFQGKRVVFD